MPDYGFGALAIGSGAQAGLEALLRRRLQERQMALAEQAQQARERQFSEQMQLERDLAPAPKELGDYLDVPGPDGKPMRQWVPQGQLRQGVPVYEKPPSNPGTLYPVDVGGKPVLMPPDQATGKVRWNEPPASRLRTPEELEQEKELARFRAGLNTRNEASPSARFNMERTLRREWNTLSQNWRTMKNQVATMEAGLNAAKRGDMAAGAQAILVTFQKILDPTSVVRESEYARSAEGQSLMNQISGYADRLARGGVGVPLPELEKFYALGKEMVARAGTELPRIRQQFEQNAVEYGLNPRLIIAEDPAQVTPPSGARGSASGDIEWVRDPKTGKLVKKGG